MATSPNSDLVSLQKDTKARLASIKGDRSFDAVIRDLLDTIPTPQAPAAPTASATREAEEQRMIARLAAKRWSLWRRDGKIVDVGSRLVEYRIDDVQREVEFARPKRRGFAP